MKVIFLSALASLAVVWSWITVAGMISLVFGEFSGIFFMVSVLALAIGAFVGWLKSRLP